MEAHVVVARQRGGKTPRQSNTTGEEGHLHVTVRTVRTDDENTQGFNMYGNNVLTQLS